MNLLISNDGKWFWFGVDESICNYDKMVMWPETDVYLFYEWIIWGFKVKKKKKLSIIP